MMATQEPGLSRKSLARPDWIRVHAARPCLSLVSSVRSCMTVWLSVQNQKHLFRHLALGSAFAFAIASSKPVSSVWYSVVRYLPIKSYYNI